MSDNLGPPRFVWCEVVRIVATAGDETYGDGEPVEHNGLIGEEGTVFAACPRSDRRGWLIQVGAPARRSVLDDWPSDSGSVWEHVWFREEMLESKELVREWDEDGYIDLPLDREEHRAWRDAVALELEAFASQEDEADAMAERAESALRTVVEVAELGWTTALQGEGEPAEITAWLVPSSGVLYWSSPERRRRSPAPASLPG